MRRWAAAVPALVLAAACASGGSAVLPTTGATPAGAASGVAPEARTPDARAIPGPLAVLRLTAETVTPRAGDTIRVRPAALDARGAGLGGIELRLKAPERQLEVLDDSSLVALREGKAVVTVEAFRDGRPVVVDSSDRLELRIQPAPLERLDLFAPQRMYAGTRADARVRALTTTGRPRELEPEVTWRSSDQGVIRVSEAGGLDAVAPGTATISASVETRSARAEVRVVPNPIARVELRPAFADLEVGEVIHLSARALDGRDAVVEGVPLEWAVEVVDGGLERDARVDGDGAFVANTPGTYRVVVAAGAHAAAAEIRARSRPARRPVDLVARRPLPSGAGQATVLRVFEGVDGRDYAYTGTSTAGTLYAWDVTDPVRPMLTDSMKLGGPRVYDVQIDADATLAAAADGRGGVSLFDLLDPGHPRRIGPPIDAGARGATGVWLEGSLLYVTHDARDLRILDISDPATPRPVGGWALDAEGRVLHDVSVKDGFAYLSYGADGLVILDVGAGIADGTPTAARLVSRYTYSYRLGDETLGNAHRALRYRNWVFVADQADGCDACVNGPRGYVRVLDVADIEHPVQVARYRVPEAGVRDLWAEDDRLYVGYGQAGVRIVDLSGELRGDLWRQGRETGWFMTVTPDGGPTGAMSEAAQPYEGRLFVTDRDSGLWILQPAADR